MAAPVNDDKKVYVISGKLLKKILARQVKGTQNELDVKMDPVTGHFTIAFANPTLIYISQAGAPARVLIPIAQAPE